MSAADDLTAWDDVDEEPTPDVEPEVEPDVEPEVEPEDEPEVEQPDPDEGDPDPATFDDPETVAKDTTAKPTKRRRRMPDGFRMRGNTVSLTRPWDSFSPRQRALMEEEAREEAEREREKRERMTPEEQRAEKRAAREERRAEVNARYAERYAEADARRDALRPRAVDEAEIFYWLREAARGGLDVEFDFDLVKRQDGTAMRVGEAPRPGGSVRTAGGKRKFNPATTSWDTGERGPVFLTADAVRMILRARYLDRWPDVLRVVRLRRLTPAEQALKDDVLALVDKLPRNRGNREPIAAALEVSVKTISRWRREADLRRYAAMVGVDYETVRQMSRFLRIG